MLTFLPVSKACTNFFYFPTMYIYCVSPAASISPEQLSNFIKKSRNRHCNCFQGCLLSTLRLYCSHFLPFILHESGTRKALLGPWLIALKFIWPPLLLKITWLEDKWQYNTNFTVVNTHFTDHIFLILDEM